MSHISSAQYPYVLQNVFILIGSCTGHLCSRLWHLYANDRVRGGEVGTWLIRWKMTVRSPCCHHMKQQSSAFLLEGPTPFFWGPLSPPGTLKAQVGWNVNWTRAVSLFTRKACFADWVCPSSISRNEWVELWEARASPHCSPNHHQCVFSQSQNMTYELSWKVLSRKPKETWI